MSGKSTKSSASKTADDRDLARPFDPEILTRARALAGDYKIILEADEDVGYLGHVLEMPGVMGDGTTPNRCVKEVREAIVSAIATLLEKGREPPAPARELKRTAQVNIRLTEEEKLLLEEAARRNGFRGVSDFVRTTTLSTVVK